MIVSFVVVDDEDVYLVNVNDTGRGDDRADGQCDCGYRWMAPGSRLIDDHESCCLWKVVVLKSFHGDVGDRAGGEQHRPGHHGDQ